MTMRAFFARLGCRLLGRHQYDTPVFHSNCLYFCVHCGRELLGRTFDDISPMTLDEQEMIDWSQA